MADTTNSCEDYLNAAHDLFKRCFGEKLERDLRSPGVLKSIDWTGVEVTHSDILSSYMNIATRFGEHNIKYMREEGGEFHNMLSEFFLTIFHYGRQSALEVDNHHAKHVNTFYIRGLADLTASIERRRRLTELGEPPIGEMHIQKTPEERLAELEHWVIESQKIHSECDSMKMDEIDAINSESDVYSVDSAKTRVHSALSELGDPPLMQYDYAGDDGLMELALILESDAGEEAELMRDMHNWIKRRREIDVLLNKINQ